MTTPVVFKFKQLAPNAILPQFANHGDSGADICAITSGSIPPGRSILIKTGIACDIPFGYELQVRPRSGLANKHKVTVLNAPGTVDSGYKGEIGVILVNHHQKTFVYNAGDRIAQLVPAKLVENVVFTTTDDVGTSERGTGGFGSSGVSEALGAKPSENTEPTIELGESESVGDGTLEMDITAAPLPIIEDTSSQDVDLVIDDFAEVSTDEVSEQVVDELPAVDIATAMIDAVSPNDSPIVHGTAAPNVPTGYLDCNGNDINWYSTVSYTGDVHGIVLQRPSDNVPYLMLPDGYHEVFLHDLCPENSITLADIKVVEDGSIDTGMTDVNGQPIYLGCHAMLPNGNVGKVSDVDGAYVLVFSDNHVTKIREIGEARNTNLTVIYKCSTCSNYYTDETDILDNTCTDCK